MHAAMSPDNMYLRFFSLSPRAAEREAQRVCREPGPTTRRCWPGWAAGWSAWRATSPPGSRARRRSRSPCPTTCTAAASPRCCSSTWCRWPGGAGCARSPPRRWRRTRPCSGCSPTPACPCSGGYRDGVVELTFPLPGGEADRSLDGYLESVASRESRADVASLRHLLQPRSVAVVGASRGRGTVGRAILHNIVTGGFAGQVYAVNPHARSMEGLPCVASVADLPEAVDLAVIAVPPAAVPEVAAAVRPPRRAGPGGDHLGPGRRGRRPAGDLPQVRHAAGRAELLRRRRAPDRPERHIRGWPPGPASPGLVVQSGGVGIALLGAPVPARYRRVLVRVGGRQVRRVQQRPADLVGAGRA